MLLRVDGVLTVVTRIAKLRGATGRPTVPRTRARPMEAGEKLQEPSQRGSWLSLTSLSLASLTAAWGKHVDQFKSFNEID